jgi:hypothetical protein
MATPLASIPGIELYRDGIRYEFKQGCLPGLFSLNPSQEGFAPIEHISSMEIAEVRDLGGLIFSIALMPVFFIGAVLLVIWLFSPRSVIRVCSDGKLFVSVELSTKRRADAQEMLEIYRRLKYAISAKPTSSAKAA